MISTDRMKQPPEGFGRSTAEQAALYPPREPLNWALVLFPLLVSVRQGPAPALGGLILLGILSLRGRPAPRSLRQLLPLLLLAFATAVPMSRHAPIGDLVLTAGAIAVVVVVARRVTPSQALDSLTGGICVYLIANIAGWLAGVESPAASVRVGLFETDSSFLDERVLFPFTRSINEPAVAAAALLAYFLVTLREKGPRVRPSLWVGAAAAVFVIWASGTRSPLIALGVLVPVVLILPRLVRLAPTLALSAIGLPLYLNGLRTLVDAVSLRIESIPFLARGESASDIAGFSSRGYIWDTGLAYWPSAADGLARWIGYGFEGHVQSGVVYTYFVEGGFVNQPSALTLHNTLLQQLYDGGLLGVVALLGGLWVAGRRAARHSTPAAALISIIYFSAALEIFMAPTFRATPFMLTLVLSAVFPVQDLPTRDAESPSASSRRAALGSKLSAGSPARKR